MPSLGRNGFTAPRPVYDAEQKTFNSDEAREDMDQLATFALHHVTKPFPKLTVLSNYQHRDGPTLELLQAQLAELNNAHAKHLDALYTHQAEEVERSNQNDYMQYDPDDFTRKKVKRGEEGVGTRMVMDFLNFQRKQLRNKHEDQLTRLRHAHLKTIMPIQKEIASRERAAQAERARRAMILPRSYDEWEHMDPAPKLNVARFLAAPQDGDNGQTATMIKSQPHWTWENYRVLQKEYDADNGFKAKVAKYIEEGRMVSLDPRLQMAAHRGNTT